MRVSERWNQVRLCAAWRAVRRTPGDHVPQAHPWPQQASGQLLSRAERLNEHILAPWRTTGRGRHLDEDEPEILAEEEDAAKCLSEDDAESLSENDDEEERPTGSEDDARMARLAMVWRSLQEARRVARARLGILAHEVQRLLFVRFSSAARCDGAFALGALWSWGAVSGDPSRDGDPWARPVVTDDAIQITKESVARFPAGAPVLIFSDRSCPLSSSVAESRLAPSDVHKARSQRDRCCNAVLHRRGGPQGVVNLRLQCQGCKAVVEHPRAQRADGSWVLAQQPDRARALFLSHQTAVDLDLLRCFYGLWIGSGATCNALADAYAGSRGGVLGEADVHLRQFVLTSLVTYVLGQSLGIGVNIELGNQTATMDARLRELLPAVEAYFWRMGGGAPEAMLPDLRRHRHRRRESQVLLAAVLRRDGHRGRGRYEYTGETVLRRLHTRHGGARVRVARLSVCGPAAAGARGGGK